MRRGPKFPRISMNTALDRLRKGKFKVEVMTRGTIIAHKGDVHYGFGQWHQSYSEDAVARAIEDTK